MFSLYIFFSATLHCFKLICFFICYACFAYFLDLFSRLRLQLMRCITIISNTFVEQYEYMKMPASRDIAPTRFFLDALYIRNWFSWFQNVFKLRRFIFRIYYFLEWPYWKTFMFFNCILYKIHVLFWWH